LFDFKKHEISLKTMKIFEFFLKYMGKTDTVKGPPPVIRQQLLPTGGGVVQGGL
jgi:hypothetical protein